MARTILRHVRAALRPPSLTVLAGSRETMQRAAWTVALYYYLMPYMALLYLSYPIAGRANFEPISVLLGVDRFALSLESVELFVKVGFVLVSLAAALFHRHRFARIFVFVAISQVHALESSFGYINHQWYVPLFTSFALIFLPDIDRSDSTVTARNYLFALWSAQAVTALVYTMAGFNKIAEAIEQFLRGEIHSFSPYAFAYQVADWVPTLQAPALLAPYVIEYPYVSWFPYIAIQCIQLFSFWVMIRLGLHRIWGIVIVAFHIGTFLTMGISFHPIVLMVTVLFVASPFAVPYRRVADFLEDLPVVGQLSYLIPRAQDRLRFARKGV